MAFKVDGTTIVNDSREVSNIIATTAEAQAGSINNKVMTPQRTKEMIQGGTVSVIKSVQHIAFETGTFAVGSFTYQSIGASPGLVVGSGGADPTGIVFSSPGDAGTYCFFTNFTVNRFRTMLLIDHGGTSGNTRAPSAAGPYTGAPQWDNFSVAVRFQSSGGSPTNSSLQATSSTYFAYPNTATFDPVFMFIQMIEYY